jgi:hypothetical protein
MKKIITLLAVIAMFGFQGCEGPEGPPGIPGQDGQDALLPTAFQITKTFFNDPVDGYIISEPFQAYLDGDLYEDETVLIYRLEGVTNSGSKVWQLIPRTLYLSSGELDYDFNFSKQAFTIFAGGTYNLALTPEFLNNQTFRIVVSPSDLISTVDKKDYKAVINALNISESQIQNIDIQ